MPQQLSDDTQKLHLEYDIITQVSPEILKTSYTADVDLIDFITADKDNNNGTPVPAYWAPGYHYTYTVTIGANAISFTASITNWTDVNGFNYILNN